MGQGKVRPMRASILLLALTSALFLAPSLRAQSSGDWDLLFLGYGTEPEMDFGGRTVMSLQSLASRSIGSIGHVAAKHPGVTPAWEFPLAAALLLVQHEVGGHGGRAREFGLSPSYAFHYDFSAATGTARPPRTNEEGTLLAAGGAEADGVMSHRVMLDLLRPEGADGAKIPLAFMSKLDLTLYVRSAKRVGQGLVDQYRDGNDIAYYLFSRQAEERGADPAAVWDGTYDPIVDDPALDHNRQAAWEAALWNLLDPSLLGAMVNYFRQHVLGGEVRVHAPVLRAGDVGLALGTRAALGPQEVSRYLDLYAATRRGVFTVYVRDLDSPLERTYGAGAGVYGLELGPALELGLAADTWKEPDALRSPRTGTGWNLTGELDARLNDRWGLAAKLGSKSEGFLPGLPIEDGVYFGLGVRASL
jgi:hypothetical protein